MKNFITTAAFVLGLSVIAGQLSAAPGFAHGEAGFSHLEFLADHVGMTDEQESQINHLINAGQLESAVDRERIQQIHEALRSMSDNFDAGEAQLLAEELGEITARLVYSGAQTRAEIHKIFSPEQLQQLQEFKSDRMKMHSRFGSSPRGMPVEGGGS
jgi:Spy/CpxP family protein refolding chaperone